MIGRRGFITGLVSLVAAPAIVRAGSLMPVRVVDFDPAAILDMTVDHTLRLIDPPYGISPGMQALLRLLVEHDRIMARIISPGELYRTGR